MARLIRQRLPARRPRNASEQEKESFMRRMLQPVITLGVLALMSAPLQAAPGMPGRAAAGAAVESRTGLEATFVHERWGHRHRRPRHPRRWQHRHRATPYRGFSYPCIVVKPWPPGHWRHHRHRHYRGHRHPVPRHRHVGCYGGFTVVLPLPYPRPHTW